MTVLNNRPLIQASFDALLKTMSEAFARLEIERTRRANVDEALARIETAFTSLESYIVSRNDAHAHGYSANETQFEANSARKQEVEVNCVHNNRPT